MPKVSNLFSPIKIEKLEINNRLVRSATFEGLGDCCGKPTNKYLEFYQKLAEQNIGLVITGFMYISKDGQAMQANQVGIDNDQSLNLFQKITKKYHSTKTKIFAQISHAGRQTSRKSTKGYLWAVSNNKSQYFKEKPDILTKENILEIVTNFANSALRAKIAGFDGIQIHGAHGYLVHQFISPKFNFRHDSYGIDPKKKIGIKFLDEVIEAIRKKCGADFPIIIKISGDDDFNNKSSVKQLKELIHYLEQKKIAAIEISYGTMDNALNIARGSSIPIDEILKHNLVFKANKLWQYFFLKYLYLPIFKRKILLFTDNYNLDFAKIAKQETNIPIISIGGFRNAKTMEIALKEKKCDLISMCRPFICEVDLAKKIYQDDNYLAKCSNCNKCFIMCDAAEPTRCYKGI